jgi:hypothetical protein
VGKQYLIKYKNNRNNHIWLELFFSFPAYIAKLLNIYSRVV